MPFHIRHAVPVAALIMLAACGERPTPVEPGGRMPDPAPGAPGAGTTQSRHERLAYRLAVALRDPGFRSTVYQSLQSSRFGEGKIHFQRFLNQDAGKHRRRLARLTGEPEGSVARDLDEADQIEVYLPVPEHRRAWRGGANLLVATAERDHEAPVAFDPAGRRRVLDPDRPPGEPVIALGQAELAFPTSDVPAGAAPTGGTALLTSPGLYMTYAKLTSTFEGWLKGAPEFEVHVLGQDGSADVMRSYQCAGEQAGTPYSFNMDSKQWSGSVMLFSQAQLDSYKAQYPGQAVRILLLEDDDAPCVIKTDSSRFTRMIQAIEARFGELTGGRDTLISINIFRRARTLMDIIKLAWSWIKTQDEIIGIAIEDDVAREYWSGANWIVKGNDTSTKGAIRLEMR